LLDLSLRRGMRPDEIADILGADPDTVMSSRDHALEQIASDLGIGPGDPLDELRARLAELPSENWTGIAQEPERERAVEPEAERAPEQEPSPEQEPEASNVVHLPARATAPEERPVPVTAAPAPAGMAGPRAARLLLLAIGVAAVIIAIVLAVTGGSSSKKHRAPSRATPAQRAPKAAGARLAPVGPNGARARGTASISGGRLRLDVTGLPAPRGAVYEAWLYNSVIDAVPLGTAASPHVVLDKALPANARRYRYVDISLEPADGNPTHSGDSFLRVPLAKLLR
jgi:hypothetical protein